MGVVMLHGCFCFTPVFHRPAGGHIVWMHIKGYGFHLFKVENQLSPTKMTYAEASVNIQKEMFNTQMEKKFKEWLQDARKNAEINVYSERLYRL